MSTKDIDWLDPCTYQTIENKQQEFELLAARMKGRSNYGVPNEIPAWVKVPGSTKRVRYTPPPHMSRGKNIDKRARRRYKRNAARFRNSMQSDETSKDE